MLTDKDKVLVRFSDGTGRVMTISEYRDILNKQPVEPAIRSVKYPEGRCSFYETDPNSNGFIKPPPSLK